MTAQIGDIYKYRNQEYTIVAFSSPIWFDPQNFGLEPNMSSTACWRGYWCEYVIGDGVLLLQNLYLYNADNKYPPFYGVEVSPQEFENYEYYTLNDGKIRKDIRPAHFGHRVYRDVNMLIPYTGKILLGNGFMNEYYIHMGFQQGWAYENLIELSFEKGVLSECNDLSHIAKAQRKIIDLQKEDPLYPDGGNIPQFVEDSFSLDYINKVWWLK